MKGNFFMLKISINYHLNLCSGHTREVFVDKTKAFAKMLNNRRKKENSHYIFIIGGHRGGIPH